VKKLLLVLPAAIALAGAAFEAGMDLWCTFVAACCLPLLRLMLCYHTVQLCNRIIFVAHCHLSNDNMFAFLAAEAAAAAATCLSDVVKLSLMLCTVPTSAECFAPAQG
jgi:hypothetical protein